MLGPALNVSTSPAVATDFAANCDPTAASASKKSKAHVTTHGDARTTAIEILRELDLLYLGGALHAAERILMPLAMQRVVDNDHGN